MYITFAICLSYIGVYIKSRRCSAFNDKFAANMLCSGKYDLCYRSTACLVLSSGTVEPGSIPTQNQETFWFFFEFGGFGKKTLPCIIGTYTRHRLNRLVAS